MKSKKRTTGVISKITGKLGKWLRRILFRIMLWELDNLWHYFEMNGGRLFPPSFYHTHTEEEIKRITDEEIKKLKEEIEQIPED